MQNDFYDMITNLCITHNETPSGAAYAVGLSRAAASGWKRGKKPTYITLVKLAQHFGEPLDVFKDFIDDFRETEKAPADEGERLTPKMQELIDILSDSDSDMLEDVLSYTMYKVAMKNKNQP